MVFGYSDSFLESSKAVYTATEIAQQPATWRKTLRQVSEIRSELDAFVQSVLSQPDFEVIFTGAGTSEYVGNALKPALIQRLGGKVQSYATTDIVASPYVYLSAEKPTLLVSFARSGNSPESVGAVEAADKICKNIKHLFITCNAEGALAKAAETRENCFSIVLADETNDRSFAMTSSFSNMYLAALLTFRPELANDVESVAAAVERFIETGWQKTAKLIEEKPFARIVYLGSDSLKGIAQESCLKVLELTAGKVVALHDSPLGFRHGPKSVVDETTLSVLYLSDDAVTRRYELDLLRELYRDRKGSKLLCVANTADEAVTSSCDSCIELNFGKALPNALMALGYITVAQVVALQRSLSLGITPDNPCPTGEVNRVVKGVTIYPL